jgi:NarL family two-component system response regulator LiaR
VDSAGHDGARPVRVAVVNDYEIVVAGVTAALEPYADRVVVVEAAAGLPVLSDVDVVLYDTFAQRHGDGVPVGDLVPSGARLVVFSWTGDPDVVRACLDAGASGFVCKGTSAADLVDALERVRAGERVVPDGAQATERPEVGRWPGEELGLSQRESEVLALICRGLSN